MNTTALLQIRSNSTRLPGKMLLPFYADKTIPDLIIERLIPILQRENIVIATTISSADDEVVELAMRHGVKCFRGSEADVLARFIGAIEEFKLKTVLRICADNPFLRAEFITELTKQFDPAKLDYATFEFPDGTPIMQSHIGLFAEIMSADFLRSIQSKTDDPFFHEHVTNYVYSHRDEFRTLFIPVPEAVNTRRDIRLTIDTRGDFDHLSRLYSDLQNKNANYSIEELVAAIDATDGLTSAMKEEIDRNSK